MTDLEMITNAMNELHPQTLAERIRSLGNACSCSFCRGRDTEIDAVIAEFLADTQRAEIERLLTLKATRKVGKLDVS